MGLRLSTWNIAWFGQLLKGYTRTTPQSSKKVTSASGKALQALQRAQIAEAIRRMDPDVLCIQEGPSTGNVNRLQEFCDQELDGRWKVVKRPSRDPYYIAGSQGIFFLVRSSRMDALSPRLLAQSAWWEATELESRVDINRPGSGEHNRTWPIIHPLFKPGDAPSLPDTDYGDEAEGDTPPQLQDREHSHYRHPQVLVLTVGDKRVDIIGCHLKSKFGGYEYERAGALRQRDPATLDADDVAQILRVEQKAVENRIKLTTEVADLRYYIESRFRGEPDPAVFVLGDFNDGVGKEVFERKYLFHDTISNLQGDVFFASRFLNHALFDYSQEGGENHRWTARFSDVWDPYRRPEVLLDHILFTQSVTGGDAYERTGMRVHARAGRVEHAIFNAVNAVFDREEDFTSDHRPVTVDVSFASDPVA